MYTFSFRVVSASGSRFVSVSEPGKRVRGIFSNGEVVTIDADHEEVKVEVRGCDVVLVGPNNQVLARGDKFIVKRAGFYGLHDDDACGAPVNSCTLSNLTECDEDALYALGNLIIEGRNREAIDMLRNKDFGGGLRKPLSVKDVGDMSIITLATSELAFDVLPSILNQLHPSKQEVEVLLKKVADVGSCSLMPSIVQRRARTEKLLTDYIQNFLGG